jgi:Fic family protein
MNDMTKHITESNAIEGVFSLDEVERSLRVWEQLRAEKQLSHAVIKATQQHIVAAQAELAPEAKGAYRSLLQVNVTVGNYRPPAWYDVDIAMQEWLDGYQNRKPWDNHVLFEAVHPFVDGNGRAGRMLLWWQEIKEGGVPTLFRAERRFDYYHALERDRQRAMLGKERPRG